jgi:hypothetical protein
MSAAHPPANKPPSKLFIPIQAGVFEHIGDGRMTVDMWAVFSVMLKEADYETGFWKGCAEKARAAWNFGLELRTTQRAIRALCDGGYTKSFQTNGRHGNYLVAINKYPIRFGPRKGMRLNADATTDSDSPVYEIDPRQEHENDRDKDAANVSVKAQPSLVCMQNDRDTTAQKNGDTGVRDKTNDRTSDKTNDKTNVTRDDYSRGLEVLRVSEDKNEIQHQQQYQEPNAIDDGEYCFSNIAEQEEADPEDKRTTFLAEQARLFRGAGVSVNATKDHLEESWRVAQQIGVVVYLGALALWLDESEDELVISREQNLETGKFKTKYRTWPLHTFLTSPCRPLYIDKLRPLFNRYGVSGETLLFLVGLPQPLPDLTAGQIAKLSIALTNQEGFLAQSAIEEMNFDPAFFNDPQGAIDRHKQMLDEQRAQRTARRAAAQTVQV